MSLTRWRDTGGWMAFGDHRIFTQAQGRGSTALLLIHGFPTASWDFEALWPALGRAFEHVIALDLLGYGFSDKPLAHDYSLIEQADICEQLLRERGVTDVHLLAHDYGVSIAQELLARDLQQDAVPGASLRPRLRSCVFLNGGLFPETHHPRLVQRLLRTPLGPLLARLSGERAFARSFAAVFAPQTRPGPIELHDYWTLININEGRRVWPRLIGYIGERRRQRERWVGALTRTPVPLRLINGPLDPVSGAHMVARYRELVADADVVMLDGVGHYPQVEAPDRVLRALLAFHQSLPA